MMLHSLKSLCLLATAAMLVGCASGPQARKEDPLEPWNRQVFRFNDAVDRAVLKPVATTYQKVTPRPIRNGVRNFFANLKDGWSVVNNALQLKGQNAADSLSRFGINTFLGLGGVLDVATELGIERHTKDFGHTLGYWGVPAGPYLVLPLLGPSTLRDTAALPVDSTGNLVNQLPEESARNTLLVVRVVDTRANLLRASAMMEQVALDEYAFARDSYLQFRRNAIYDGNPPEEESGDNDNQEIYLESEESAP